MNAKRYRIIFNRVRGLFMAVAEFASAHDNSAGNTPARDAGQPAQHVCGLALAKLRPAVFAVLLALGAQLGLVSLARAQIVAYKPAPANQQATVLNAGNGVPLVNIQTPGAAGVSRNTYSQFDVGAPGAILNNSRSNAQTQLGGWVQGNPWLAGGSARVILNEVISSNPSALNGYVEVAGSAAQVVIANPAGISCNGCGFVNASRATLTTGTPVMNGDTLEGYRVAGGTIRIEGAGMDASRVGYTDLIARAVEVNAGLWAQVLKVTAGANQINAENTQATPIAGNGTAPAFAIDVAQLGGMYAGKITLVGTEAGVGVRNAGYIGASAGEVLVTADGRLTNSGSLNSNAPLQVEARAGIDNAATGSMYSQSDLGLVTQGDISNSGVIATRGNLALTANGSTSRITGAAGSLLGAGVQSDGALIGDARLDASATQAIALHGQLLSSGQQSHSAGSIDLSGSQTSARALALQSAATLDLSGATLAVSQALTASAGQTLRTDNAKLSAEQIVLGAKDLSNIRGEIIQTGSGDLNINLPGSLDNTQGRIATNSQNLGIKAGVITNTDARIEHASTGHFSIDALTFSGARGQIISNGRLDVTAQTAVLDAATTAAGTLNITANTLSNQTGRLISHGDMTIAAERQLDNSGGTISSNGTLHVSADAVKNQTGSIQSTGDNTLISDSLNNRQGQISAGQQLAVNVEHGLDNTSGLLAATRKLEVSAAQIDNQSGTVGSVQGSAQVTARSGRLDNSAGRIEAAGALELSAQGVGNADGVLSGEQLSVNSQGAAFDNTRGKLMARGILDLQSGALQNKQGLIQAGSALSIDTHGQRLDNTDAGSQGGIVGQSRVRLTTGDLNTAAGYIGSVGALTVSGQNVDNTQTGLISSNSALTITAQGRLSNSSQLSSGERMSIEARAGIDNAATGSLYAQSDLGLSTQGVITNNGVIAARGNLSLTANGSTSRIVGAAGSLLGAGVQSDGALIGDARLDVSATQAIAQHGQLLSSGQQSHSAGTIDLTGSQTSARALALQSNSALDLSGATLAVSQALTASAGQTLRTDRAKLSADQIVLGAKDLSNIRGEIIQTGSGDLHINLLGSLDNTQGRIATNSQNFTLNASHLINTDGKLDHAGNGKFNIDAAVLNGERGQIGSNGELELTAQTARIDGGLTSAQGVVMDSSTLSNRAGTISSSKSIQINAGTLLDNTSGVIASKTDSRLTVGVLANQHGIIQAGGSVPASLVITASGAVDNSQGGRLTASGDNILISDSLNNRQGQISAGQQLAVNVVHGLDNTSGLLAATRNLDVSAAQIDNQSGTVGSVQGNAQITARSGRLDNSSGRIEAAGSLGLSAQGLSNADGVLSGEQLSVNSQGAAFDNTRGKLVARGTLDLHSGALQNKQGLIQAAGALSIDTHGQRLDNTETGSQGGIVGQSRVRLSTGDLNNTAGYIGSVDALTVSGQIIDNSQTGLISSAENIQLAAATLNNQGGQMQALGSIDLALSDTLNNRSGLILAGEVLSTRANRIVNRTTQGASQGLEAKTVSLSASSLDNHQGAIRASEVLSISSSGQVDNSQGLLTSAKNLTLSDPASSGRSLAISNTAGTIIAGQALNIDANSLTGDGKLLSQGDLTIQLRADFNNTGELTANGQATVNIVGTLINQSMLQAGTGLAINAASLDNQVSGKLAADTVKLKAAAFNNRGLIDGGTVRIDATTLNNLGTGRIYGNTLALAASSLNNLAEGASAPVIAARNSLDLGVNTLNNRDGALIFSAGDMAFGGYLDASGKASGTAGAINNIGAGIEALGSLKITATALENARQTLQMERQPGASRTLYSQICENPPSCTYISHVTETQSDSSDVVTQSSPQATILSGGSMGLAVDRLANTYSMISAGGNLEMTGASLSNTGQELFLKTDWVRSSHLIHWGNRDHGTTVTAGSTQTKIGSVDAIISAGGALTGNFTDRIDNVTIRQSTAPVVAGSGLQTGAFSSSHVTEVPSLITTANVNPAGSQTLDSVIRVNAASDGLTAGAGLISRNQAIPGVTTAGSVNGHVEDKAERAVCTFPAWGTHPVNAPINASYVVRRTTPNITLPVNRLFQMTSTPASNYLIETDPVFAGYRQWLSSDSMLKALSLDPATTQKRLGDGFYEQRLITEQVGQLTGRRFLAGYTDDEAQYRALIDAGVTYAKAHGLRPGVELSAAQMATLTTDIVWLIEREVAGQKVLVPQVYARLKEGDLAPSGAVLAGNSIDLKTAGDLTNSGHIAGRELVVLNADNIKNLGGRMSAQNTVLNAQTDLLNLGGRIEAQDRLIVSAGRDLTVQSSTVDQHFESNGKASGRVDKTVVDRIAGLYVTGDKGLLIASAGNDLKLLGAVIDSRGSALLNAGHDLKLGTVIESNSAATVGKKTRWNENQRVELGSMLSVQGDLALSAKNDLTARAATVVSQSGTLAAAAGNDLKIESGEARYASEYYRKSSSSGLLSSSSKERRDTVESTTALASTFSGEKVDLSAGRDLSVKGSNVVATQDATLSAGRDLSITAATETHKETHYKSEKKSGFSASLFEGVHYGKSSATQSDNMADSRTVGSEISGHNVLLLAGRDATVSGSRVLADRDIDIIAGRDVNILASQNTHDEAHNFKSSASSIMLAPGVGLRQTLYGQNSAKQNSQGHNETATASLLSANSGDLTVIAGADKQYANSGTGNITLQGADLLARHDIQLEGNAVHLLASQASSQIDSASQSKSLTVGAALAGTVGGQLTRAYDMAKAAYDGTGNKRLDGALALKGGYDAWKAVDGMDKSLATAADGPAKGNGSAFGVSFSIGSSKSQSESHESARSERGSSLQAENILIKARETDITAVGAKLQADGDITLDAKRDIHLAAARNTQEIQSNNQSSSVGVGVTIGIGQQNGISFQISASQAKGKTKGNETTYDNTLITAGEQLTLKSGGDTTLKGAQVGGKHVVANIGGDLTIETLQDQSDYKSKQTSSGFSLSLCLPPICVGSSSGSLSLAQQKIDHSYRSAVGQSGIAAGEGGFDIKVAGDTHLKGGALTSQAEAKDNHLETRRLTYEDLQNAQKTKASSQSLSLAGGYNFGAAPAAPAGAGTEVPAGRDPGQGLFTAPGTSLAGQAATNLLANLGGNAALPKNGSESSQTLAVISPAQITLTGDDAASHKNAETLSARDAKTANTSLSNSLSLQDAARLEKKMKDAQQTAQAASLVGQVAAGLIGDLSTAMRKPIDDANLRKDLDVRQKQAEQGGTPLSNVERYELARLDKEGMTAAQAAQTLKDPAAIANYENWKEGGTTKIVLHGLAGIITAKVGKGNALVGAAAGALNEAVLPEMSKYLESKGIKEGSEEYKGYMQLGSAMLGAGIGALAGGSKTIQNASLGGTVAHNATTYNFLMHFEAKRLAELKQLRQACSSAASCASIDNEIRSIQAADARRDEEIKSACANPSSSSCVSWNSLLQAAKDSYQGRDNNDPNGIIAKEQREAANLAFYYNQRVQHPVGYDIGGKVLVGLAGAAIAVVGFEAATTCFANLPSCVAALNSAADALLADGAVGVSGYTASKVAAQELKQAITAARAEMPMGKMVDDLMGHVVSVPSLSKTAQAHVNDGKLGEQLARQVLKEETGRDFRALQNASDNGADGVAIVRDPLTIYVTEVKSSINGVDKAKAATGNPTKALTEWANLASEGKGSWADLSLADKALALEINALIKSGVPVKGVQVRVGIPRAGESGVPKVSFSEWK